MLGGRGGLLLWKGYVALGRGESLVSPAPVVCDVCRGRWVVVAIGDSAVVWRGGAGGVLFLGESL